MKHYTSVQNYDWPQADSNFSKYKIVSDDKDQINYYQQQFAARQLKLKNVNTLLKQADKLLEQNRTTKPKSKNALDKYTEVLTLMLHKISDAGAFRAVFSGSRADFSNRSIVDTRLLVPDAVYRLHPSNRI